MSKGKIVEGIEKSIFEEIQDLENNKSGLSFMIGVSEDYQTKVGYLTQIFNIEEKISELTRQLNG